MLTNPLNIANMSVKLIICNSNPRLFEKVAAQATTLLASRGISATTLVPIKSSVPKDKRPPHYIILEKFSNGEIHVDIGESIRGSRVYVMQTEDSTSEYTANDYLMEMVFVGQAAKLAGATVLHGIIPSYFYARQDKKDRPRVPMSAKYVAGMLEMAGFNRIVVVDLHSAQTQCFFGIDTPCDNTYAIRYIRERLEQLIAASGRSKKDFVLVAPDTGGEKRNNAYSKAMGIRAVQATKKREHETSTVETLVLYGMVEGSDIGILIDDMADTFGTMEALVKELARVAGFKELWVVVTHPILSGKAIERLNNSHLITKFVCTNTIDRTAVKEMMGSRFEEVDISPLLARAILIIETGGSMSALFETAEAPTPLHKVMTPPTGLSDMPPLEL